MSIIRQLPYIIEEAERRNLLVSPCRPVLTEEWTGEGDHRLFRGDNLALMKYLCKCGEAGRIQMIYIDPPFFTRSDYDAVVDVGGSKVRHPAYRDSWTDGLEEYLTRLAQSLLLMRELLASDGLLWLHLDWHASHYARVLLDEIFGAEGFVNEIIWEYKSGGSTSKRFARKHDNILVYSRGKSFRFHPLKEKSYNRGLKPYRFKGVEEFCDEVGWYTMVNMKDVWQLDMVGRTSGERTGYATQKPEKLLERIVACCTDPGDLVADFFCGSGTLGAVAARLGRRSLQCDTERLAIEKSLERITAAGAGASVFEANGAGEHREHERAFEAVFGVEVNHITLAEVRDFRLPEGMDSKSAGVLAEALAADSLSVIESWSVDPACDGEVFRPVATVHRDKQGLATRCEIEGILENVMVKLVDVMGRAEYYRL